MTFKRVFSVSLLVLLSACASTGNKGNRADGGPTMAGTAINNGDRESAAAKPVQIDAADLLGATVDALEALTGAPAFVRREGVGEFRRYDLPDCRVYAVTTAGDAGQPVVRSLSTGGTMPAAPAPDLQDCLNGD